MLTDIILMALLPIVAGYGGILYGKKKGQRVVLAGPKGNCEVLALGDSSQTHTALGISQERMHFLDDMITRELEREDIEVKFSNVIIILSKECVHPNELAYAAYSIGHLSGHDCIISQLPPFLKFSLSGRKH